MSSKKKVFVGLSGGVDSATSAAILKDQGFDVVGVFIRVWSPDWLPCTWPEERRDAMRVCAHLDIPFLTLDLEEEYKNEVADYMIEEYKKGRTPNPDVMCNKEIKFGAFYDWAMAQGADFVATGHYARQEGGRLLAGLDKDKDQSYFLWNLRPEQMNRVLFPIGDKKKAEVRKLAEKFNVPVSQKKDSQGVCFLGKLDMRDFLKHYIDENPGDVLDESGNVVGGHEGALFYTLGQRHGFEIFKKETDEKPKFIIAKDLEKNTITVSENKPEEVLNSKEVLLEDVNWISGTPNSEKKYKARVRYRQELQDCYCSVLQNTAVRITFSEPQILNPGQSLVIYDGELCLGGGIIK